MVCDVFSLHFILKPNPDMDLHIWYIQLNYFSGGYGTENTFGTMTHPYTQCI